MRNERKPWKSVRSQWLTRIGFLLIAFTLWALMELGQEKFESRISVPVQLVGTPNDRLIVNPPDVLRVLSKAEGLYAFQEKFREQRELELPFDAFEEGANGSYYLSNDRFAEVASAFLPSSVRWNLVDTLWLETSSLNGKLVPVVSNLKLTFQEPFYQFGKPQLNPDSIFVFGREEILDTLEAIGLPRYIQTEVNHPISYYAELNLEKGITSTKDVVHVVQDVLPYTEKQLVLRLIVPDEELEYTASPNRVNIRVRVPMDGYEEVDELGFKAVVEPVEGGSAIAPVRVVRVPENVEIIDWSPHYVDLIKTRP